MLCMLLLFLYLLHIVICRNKLIYLRDCDRVLGSEITLFGSRLGSGLRVEFDVRGGGFGL